MIKSGKEIKEAPKKEKKVVVKKEGKETVKEEKKDKVVNDEIENKSKVESKKDNTKYYWVLFIASCVLLLFIGWVFGYLLAHHGSHKRGDERFIPQIPVFDGVMQENEESFKCQKKRMEKALNEMENDFLEMREDMFDDRWEDEFEDFNDWRDAHSRGSFKYYQKATRDWKDSSYEMNWNWNEGEDNWTIVINWINTEWKAFSFSWTMQDWRSVWVLVDEDGNVKDFSFDDINISDIYKSANHIDD